MITQRLQTLAVVAALALLPSAVGHHQRPKMPGPSWDRTGPYVNTLDTGFNRTYIKTRRWHRTWWFGTAWNAAGRTVTFYWDGQQVYSQPFPVGAGHPEYVIFDYQMFANGVPPPPQGATMLVDWARAWRVG